MSSRKFTLPFFLLSITFCVSGARDVVDTTIFPPTRAWMADSSLTGEGIWINIGMERFDTRRPDFREDSSGVSVLRRVPGWNGNDTCCSHGTHVAGIAAGNGWMSEFSGGARYQWRGVAFKSLLAGRWGDFMTGDGDVNNHSHTADGGAYGDQDRSIDRTLFNHKAYRHTVVYSSGDDGAARLHSGNLGYYSLTVNAKNPITVGASFLETPFVVGFSSIGPTYDGRIKPDLVAPGSSFFLPERDPVPLRIFFDSIVIRNGTVKKAWRFDTADRAEGWGNLFETDHFVVNHGALGFDTRWIGNIIQNTGFDPFTSSLNDTLILGYKLVHPDIPSRMTHLQCGISWGKPAHDSLQFVLAAPDTNGHEARFALADLWGYVGAREGRVRRWKGGNRIGDLWLGFGSDSVQGIYSVAESGNTNGNYRYEEGTSMSAPYVTGVVALMLQAHAKRHLDSVLLIHTQAPWNSSLKAILVHTATDLIKTAPLWTERFTAAEGNSDWLNPDLSVREPLNNAHLRYYRGPDYASGYGLVNIPKAVAYVDTSKFKQGSLATHQSAVYEFTVRAKPSPRPSPTQVGEGVRGGKEDFFGGLRATLAWDDYEGDPTQPAQPQLVNDLDLTLVSPKGRVFHPWSLTPLPHNTDPGAKGLDPIRASDIDSAHREGPNRRDNVEVVDVPTEAAVPGKWKLIVSGYAVPQGPQDFSIVGDFVLKLLKQEGEKTRRK